MMENKKDELDAFWDLSSLIPQKRTVSRQTKSAHTVEISANPRPVEASDGDSSTVIKRYIDPLHFENKRIKRESFEDRREYFPEGSLLHKVVLKKRKCAYELYMDFLNDALKYRNVIGKEAPYVSFYSYVPQYDQLSADQLAYYLWWRECFKRGGLIKTELSYILLYVYELINLGDEQDLIYAQSQLAEIWNAYHKDFPSIAGKMAVWICDFSLIHGLEPPTNISRSVTKYTSSLKEFYIHFPKDDYERCARSLLKYGTEYDYHTSKFATERNAAIFDRHVFGAVLTAVRFFSKDGKMLSELASEDSKLIRNSFEGALCVSKWRYELEVKYCSFSRSNELRFIMGDIVKYAENKIRAFIGIKSKLSVYSIGMELQKALDAYFDAALARETPILKKKEEKQAYDVLYDVAVKPFSIENAKRIEDMSWSTTQDLISAFEEVEIAVRPVVDVVETKVGEETASGELPSQLGEYLAFALAIKNGDIKKAYGIANEKGMMPEAVVDAINEIAADAVGDIIIEDNGNGFEVIDCYRDLI